MENLKNSYFKRSSSWLNKQCIFDLIAPYWFIEKYFNTCPGKTITFEKPGSISA